MRRQWGTRSDLPSLRSVPLRNPSTPRCSSIGYEESGAATGFPIVLLHGFPDDVRAWDEVTPPLVKAGHRVLIPYLRGYGPTRFRDPAGPRMAETGGDRPGPDRLRRRAPLRQFAVRLRLGRTRGGHCGGAPRRSCPRGRAHWRLHHSEHARRVAAVISRRRARHLVPVHFNTERGRAGLQANRRFCRYLWETWSPTWKFTDDTYNRTAASFDNPDFVDVVIHSYRHRI